MYKHNLYLVDTKYGCGGVRVGQDGCINETCPLYRWMMGKKFVEVLNGLKRSYKLNSCKKVMEEFDPF